MHCDTYHHIEVHEPPIGGMTRIWVERMLANARARFLQRLGITSPRLRGEGMRLRVTAPVIDLEPPAPASALGVTTRLIDVDNCLRFAEALYLVGEAWQPVWRGETRIWAEGRAGPEAMPDGMRREASAWMRIVRGSVPVVAGRVSRPTDYLSV